MKEYIYGWTSPSGKHTYAVSTEIFTNDTDTHTLTYGELKAILIDSFDGMILNNGVRQAPWEEEDILYVCNRWTYEYNGEPDEDRWDSVANDYIISEDAAYWIARHSDVIPVIYIETINTYIVGLPTDDGNDLTDMVVTLTERR